MEGLEERLLLYTATGDHFQYNSRITWSIMPDGTQLGGGVTSNLVATLNQDVGSGWLQAIQDAFAQWENVANVNVVQVSDNGDPFNSGNIQQDSPLYGDIRIGGFAQASSVLAFAMLPPPNNGGSDAGDIFFNTAQTWQINNTFDLETVAIHEIGHSVAGLGESTVPQAAEYEYYNGIKQGLAQDDINGIDALWGPRAEDPIEQATGNTSWKTAAPTNSALNTSTDQIVLPGLDVASQAESYWFQVTIPASNNGTLTAQVQSTNLSELSPRIVIFNSNLQGVGKAIAPTNAYGYTISASVSGVTAGSSYYVEILGSNVGANGVGAYDLTLSMGGQAIATIPPLNTLVYAQADQGGYGIYEKTEAANPMPSMTDPETVSPATHPATSTPSTTPSQVIPGVVAITSTQSLTLGNRSTATHINVPHPTTPLLAARQKAPVTQSATDDLELGAR